MENHRGIYTVDTAVYFHNKLISIPLSYMYTLVYVICYHNR